MTRTVAAARRPSASWTGVIVAIAAISASCGGSGDTAANPTTPLDTTAAPQDSDPLFVRTGEDDGEATPAPDSTPPAAGDTTAVDEGPVVANPGTTTTTIPVPLVPDTGVPGIDSDNDFCRSWSEFAGSFRALGVVSAIRDESAALRLEVIASEVVIAAIAGMGDSLPAELEPERDILLSAFAGPFGRRALAANEALTAAGVGGDDFELLADAWLTTLADVGIDDPEFDVVVPVGVDADLVDAAAAAFAATTPPIGGDPSLATFTEIPLTAAYTLANCPDAGTLAGNDDL